MKWGRLTFTVNGDWHHWLCGIASSKRGTRLVFHKGALLEDPDRVLTGAGRYTREVPAAVALDRPTTVAALVHSAVVHRTDMLD